MKPTLLDVYRSPLCIWVEDQLTHDVLTELWQDQQFHVLVASGKEGVRAMVGAQPPSVRGKVFGVIDRDFEADNQARWRLPDVFVSPCAAKRICRQVRPQTAAQAEYDGAR